MLKLCGTPVSNYYNKIKLALLEKNIPFSEELIMPSQDDSFLKRSPMGKIPVLLTDEGSISESQAILEYLEDTFPQNALYPSDPFSRAKCREIIQHLELNLELIARRLYPEAFFGQSVPDVTRSEVREKIEKSLNGFARLVKFSPFAAGDYFSAADCTLWPSCGIMSKVFTKVYGQDYMATLEGLNEYMALMESRSSVQKVALDRDKAMQAFFEKA